MQDRSSKLTCCLLLVMAMLSGQGWSRHKWTEAQRAVLAPYSYTEAVLSDDDRTFIFLGHRRSDTQYGLDRDRSQDRLYRLDLNSEKAEPVFSEEDFKKFLSPGDHFDLIGMVFSPQGSFFALGRFHQIDGSNYTEDILLVNLKSRAVRVLVADGKLNRNYHFSPDEKYLSFEAYPTNFWWPNGFNDTTQEGHAVKIVELKSGKVQAVRVPTKGCPSYTGESGAWSPDSRYFAFTYSLTPEAGREVCIYDLRTRVLKKTRSSANENLYFEDNNLLCVPYGIDDTLYFDTDLKKVKK